MTTLYKCPRCKSTDFAVEVESKTKPNIQKIYCKNCLKEVKQAKEEA